MRRCGEVDTWSDRYPGTGKPPIVGNEYRVSTLLVEAQDLA